MFRLLKKVIVVFIFLSLLLAIGMGVYFSIASEQRMQEEAIQAQEITAREMEAKQIKKRVKAREYSEQKDKLISRYTNQINEGDYLSVINGIESYYPYIGNQLQSELKPLYIEALLGLVKPIPKNKFDENFEIYEKLITLSPNDEKIKSKYEHYKQASETLKEVKDKFSALDGGYPPLVQYIKSNMHNPKSFEHVETRYSVKANEIYIFMKYRGFNGFGAVVTQNAKLKIDLDGKQTLIN